MRTTTSYWRVWVEGPRARVARDLQINGDWLVPEHLEGDGCWYPHIEGTKIPWINTDVLVDVLRAETG